MIEFSAPLLFLVFVSFLGARIALLAGWYPVAGAARLLALWAASCWLGYGTPLYVALAAIALGVVWWMLRRQLVLLVVFELSWLAALVWYSSTQIVVIYLVALALFDQLLVRFLLLRFDRQQDPQRLLHRLLVVAGLVAAMAVAVQYYRAPVQHYVDAHSATASLQLVPQGAAGFWFHQRELTGTSAGGAVDSSVYWEARFAGDTNDCVLAFHGAASAGSLQPAARAIAAGARRAGLRYFAIDHPGFGASPTPAAGAPVDSWDPALLTSAVLERMKVANCTHIRALGHSQGVTEALRLLTNNDPAIAEVLVLGAGLYSADPAREAYWHERFHQDRGLDFANPTLDFSTWKLVRDLYYLNQEYCATTQRGKNYRLTKPLNYVQFAQEHPNLVATRDELWSCLDYPDKQRSLLPSDHYLDAVQLGSLVFVPRAIPALVAGLLPPQENSETESVGK